jgi:nucleoside-diphosphate-sugar epimerase
VHVSSAEVYGQPRRSPVSEDDELAPTSPYGAAKLGAEAMVRAVTPTIGIETVILRPFVIYGRGMRATSVVATVVAQAVAGPVVEVADPRPVRDFVHVDDVARACVLACTRPLPPGPQTCNVGSGTGTSIAELAELALLAAGRRGEVRSHGPDRSAAANIDGAVADTRRAAELLEWYPETALAAGLAGMVADERGGEDG